MIKIHPYLNSKHVRDFLSFFVRLSSRQLKQLAQSSPCVFLSLLLDQVSFMRKNPAFCLTTVSLVKRKTNKQTELNNWKKTKQQDRITADISRFIFVNIIHVSKCHLCLNKIQSPHVQQMCVAATGFNQFQCFWGN